MSVDEITFYNPILEVEAEIWRHRDCSKMWLESEEPRIKYDVDTI